MLSYKFFLFIERKPKQFVKISYRNPKKMLLGQFKRLEDFSIEKCDSFWDSQERELKFRFIVCFVGRKVTVNLTVKNVGNKVAIKFYEAFS